MLDHGTVGLYAKGCRCEACRAAMARQNARYKQGYREEGRARAELIAAKRLAALESSAAPATVHIHGVGDVEV